MDRIDQLNEGLIDGWMGGWVDGWIDGWMDGRTHRQTNEDLRIEQRNFLRRVHISAFHCHTTFASLLPVAYIAIHSRSSKAAPVCGSKYAHALYAVPINQSTTRRSQNNRLYSVKCCPGGRKIRLFPSISKILSHTCYHCVQYTKRHLMSLITHC